MHRRRIDVDAIVCANVLHWFQPITLIDPPMYSLAKRELISVVAGMDDQYPITSFSIFK